MQQAAGVMEAVSRLKTLSPKAQIAILLVVKEETLKRRQAKDQSGQARECLRML